jgi:hypothetical protein
MQIMTLHVMRYHSGLAADSVPASFSLDCAPAPPLRPLQLFPRPEPQSPPSRFPQAPTSSSLQNSLWDYTSCPPPPPSLTHAHAHMTCNPTPHHLQAHRLRCCYRRCCNCMYSTSINNSMNPSQLTCVFQVLLCAAASAVLRCPGCRRVSLHTTRPFQSWLTLLLSRDSGERS